MVVDNKQIPKYRCFKRNCMFYQLLRVQHSCSSTQPWGSSLPSIVETKDQNSRGCPLLFSNRNLGSFSAQEREIHYTHNLWEVVAHFRLPESVNVNKSTVLKPAKSDPTLEISASKLCEILNSG